MSQPAAGNGEATAADTRDVIFTFSYVTWGGAWQRGMNFAQDRLAQTLTTHPRVRKLIIANPFRSLPAYLGRSILGQDSVPPPSGSCVQLHQPFRLRRRDPRSLRAIERAYAAYDRRLERTAHAHGLHRPAVITMHPLIAGFARLDWAGAVTFYASDDWSAAPEYRRWWPAYDDAYSRMRASGRAVCAVSEAIIERLAPTGAHAVVPNGVDPREWAVPGPAPDWFQALPRPRLLYVGTLDGRLDTDCVRAAAAAHPRGSVVLVGRLADPRHLAAIQGLPNVHLRGRAGRDSIPGLVAAADACVVPHRRTRFTTAMSPLKVYEYLAGGRPVAAVDLPPLRDVDGRVVLARDAGDFPLAVARALALGPAKETEREDFVRRHAWQQRHERVLQIALRPSA